MCICSSCYNFVASVTGIRVVVWRLIAVFRQTGGAGAVAPLQRDALYSENLTNVKISMMKTS